MRTSRYYHFIILVGLALALLHNGSLGIPAGTLRYVRAQAPATTPIPPQTISFQEGVWPVSSYFGVQDTTISQNEPDENRGTRAELLVDGDDPNTTGKDKSSLLRWDVSAIPTGSLVQAATLVLNVFNPSPNTYSVYEVKRNWVEGEAAWNQSASLIRWEIAGAIGSGDRGSSVLGSITPNGFGFHIIPLNAAGVAVVQAWVNNPATNFGFMLASTINTDGFDFYSSETLTTTHRPRFVITYQAGGSPPPKNETSGSPFRNPLPLPSGVAASLNRLDDTFLGNCPTLVLNQTTQVFNLSPLGTGCVLLKAFDAQKWTGWTIFRPDNSIYLDEFLQPYKSGEGRFDFSIGIGQPLGQYRIRFSQGAQSAQAVFTLEAAKFPRMTFDPPTGSPGKDIIIYLAGFPGNTRLLIYRYRGVSNGKTNWDYVTYLDPPKVNERGEATYVLHTQGTDRQGQYLVTTNGFDGWRFWLK